MSSQNEICYSIINTVRPKLLKGDSINKEIVAFHVKNVRAQLARQSIGKYGYLDKQYTQTLGCVDLVEADKSECCEYPTGCIILRTSVPMPSIINGCTNLFTRVGPVNLSEPKFDHIEFERVPFEGLNRFTSSLTKFFIANNNNYIYLLIREDDYLKMGLEVISVQGVLENPEDASSFHNCSTGEACFSPNSKYPIPDSVLPILQEMVIKMFIKAESNAPIDSTSDNKVNPSSQTVNK